ncbi:MAG: maleylacetoacetate isomerase [Alphaproteobacteria bacterium]|nr:maleylacetoacetate isomerase [Alphaproteobacteria bacterium]
MDLYGFFRSSASYRLRIALNLKGLDRTEHSVHLRRGGGEQYSPEFRKLNPQELVPVLVDDGLTLTQSMAILEYLEERYPEVPLLPKGLGPRAEVRKLAQAIACDIHPINNLRVLQYLTGPAGLSEEDKNNWILHWVGIGFRALETELARSDMRGDYCVGDSPTIADCCLIPQIFNARRFGLDMSAYPTLVKIENTCAALGAFQDAHPSKQDDAE